MTKSEFLAQLAHKLRVLPESDLKDALEYYEGYISDAENEAAAIAELGSPGEVASTILANYVSQKPNTYNRSTSAGSGTSASPPPRRRSFRTAYIAIFAIFAVPIGIPLAAAAFGLIVALFSIIFSVFVTGIALLIGGGISIIATPFAFANDFWFGMFNGGLGIAALGLGILVLKGAMKLAGGFPAIMQAIRRRRSAGAAGGSGAYQSGSTAWGEKPWSESTSSNGTASSGSTWGDPQYSNSPPPPFGNSSGSHSDSNKDGSYHESTWDGNTHGRGNSTWGDPQYSNSMPLSSQEVHDASFTPRRRLPGVGFALLLIIVGAAMFGLAWHNGARGGTIAWGGGRVNIVTAHHTTYPENINEIIFNERSDAFHEVHITASNRNVVIMPSDTARAVYTGTANVNIGIENGILSITQLTSGTRTVNLMDMDFSPGSSREIRLYLPPEFFGYTGGRIIVRTTIGNIQVEGNVPNLVASATTGNITVANNANNAGLIDLRTTTGRISVNNIRHTDQLYARATTGRIEVRNITSYAGAITFQTTTGNITASNINHTNSLFITATTGSITVQNIESDVNIIEVRSTTGAQTYENIPFVGSFTATATTGRVRLTDISWANLRVRTTTGRITVTRGNTHGLDGNATATDISATTGAVSLEMLGSQQSYRANLISSSGTIRLNNTRLADRGVIGTGTGSNAIDIRTTSGRIDLGFGR